MTSDVYEKHNPDEVPRQVIEEVAVASAEAPTELAPLYETVEPGALERIIESADTETVVVRFTYCGHRVVVDGTGDVTVEENDEQ